MSMPKLLLLVLACALSSYFILTALLGSPKRPNMVLRAGPGPARLRKDCGFKNLATLLNKKVDWQAWRGQSPNNMSASTTKLFQAFLRNIEPWVTAEPAAPLLVSERPVPLSATLDCARVAYKHVLSGKRLPAPRPIIDFVPFGYDSDLLEVRLFETHESVDLYVVFESPRNHKGLRKGLYFNQSITYTNRFSRFMHKIIHVVATEEEMKHMLSSDRMKDGFTQSTGTKNPGTAWELENSQRQIPVQRLIGMRDSPLKDSIFKDTSSIVLQNDGDEIWNGNALYHLKHCELKQEIKWPVHALPLSMKKNFHWLQQNRRIGECVKVDSPLRDYLWHLGPSAFPLKWALEWKEVKRPGGATDCFNNFGVGGGFHMSSVAEPSHYWHKRAGVIDQEFGLAFGRPAMDKRLIAAGLKGAITPQLLVQTTISPWCHPKAPALFVGKLPAKQQAAVESTIPWVVKQNPKRFCFLLPNEQTATFFTAQDQWTDLCCSKKKSATCEDVSF